MSESTVSENYDLRLYRSLFDAAGDAIIVSSVQGLAIECNQATLELFACTREQIIGSSPISWSPEFQPAGGRSDEMAAEVLARAKAGEVVRFEWENRRSDGKPLPVDVTVRFARLEGDEMYVVISRDLTERRQVEALRQDALDRFRQLTQLVPGVVYQFRLRPDGNSCMPYVSGAFQQMFGLSANEVREDATKALMRAHPDDVEGLMTSIQMSAKDMTPWQHEYRLKLDDGTERWVFGNSLPQREVDGSILWHGFITDITERKRAEAILLESEQRWKFALEGAGEGVWDWNIQTGDAVYSRRWKEMLGYAEGEIGKNSSEWSSRVHPEDMPKVMAAIQAHIDGKTPSAAVEFRMLCKDGSWLWTLGRGMVVSRDASGKGTRMIGTNADITERKQAEKTIRESESRFRSLMENIAGVAVQGYTLDGTVLYWNPASERLYGYSAAEALGANLLDLIFPPDMHDSFKMAMQQMATAGEPIPADEWMLKNKAGKLTPVFSSHALVQPIGREPELFSLGIDLSDRNRARDALKQSEAFKEAILNSVAAEIVVIDGNGVILAVNQHWRQYALDNGLKPGRVAPNIDVGSNYLSICAYGAQADSLAQEACSGISAVLQGRLPSFSLEYPCHSPGRLRWFNMVVMPLGHNSQGGASITHTDVTAIKQADQRVLLNESYLSAVFDSALDAVIGMDDQGRITDWNQQAQTIFGWHKAVSYTHLTLPTNREV